MLKNYLRTAFRNLWRHKGFSILNILGLTIGMSACFLIFLYVKFELSYDDFHPKGDRIYRIVTDIVNPSVTLHENVAAPAMPVAAKRDFPEIDKVVRSVSGIVRLLSREFLVLVGIAFLAATPVSFFLMKKWLDGFAYRINIFSAWWVFILAGLGALAIALFTISFQAVKAALANPVHSLRSE